MPPRTLVLLALGFAGGVGVAACSPATTTCSAATCGGCCDATGKCQSGATAEACGQDGLSCGRCGTGTVCMAGECRASTTGGGGGTTGGGTGGGTTGGGTGGGTTGGGTGGGGTGGGTGGGATGGGAGGGGGCRQLTMLATPQADLKAAEYLAFNGGASHYNYATWVYGNGDGLRLEVVYPNDTFPTLPSTGTFTAATRYGNCSVCAIFNEGCDQAGVCTAQYLAQGGSLTITRADRDSAGRLAGSGSNLRFNQWDLQNDVAEGSGCVTITTVGPFDIGWNADGGALPQ